MTVELAVIYKMITGVSPLRPELAVILRAMIIRFYWRIEKRPHDAGQE